ncbi:MAG: transposase [Saprospiraceae bacterium]|nr:transposase [Saprospiraceae bacterium]MBK8633960.1 transposase [Saprospiraceae bacterium]
MLFEIKNGNAGGVDVGSKFHCASIGPLPTQQMTVGVTTADLRKLCEWFVSNKVETVAMESTGFYWKQLFVMIQEYGMEAVLVNPLFTKNIRNRKPSDMADAQWIWKLHATGLLPSSFQPSAEIEQIRTLARHRKSLLEGTSRCVKKIQKSLVLMNIQLPAVISDIMGTSGKAIIRAILSGQRDAKELAQLAGKNLKTSKEDLEKALEGNWRESNLFELKQNYDHYEFLRSQIEECDTKIDELITLLIIKDGKSDDLSLTKSKKKKEGKRMRQSLK